MHVTVKVIEGLKIREVPVHSTEEPVVYEKIGRAMRVHDEVRHVFERTVLPVHQLSRQTPNGRQDTYIAYDKEVQELLEMPFDTLKNELATERELTAQLCRDCATLKIKNATLVRMGFWARFMFLLKGEKYATSKI